MLNPNTDKKKSFLFFFSAWLDLTSGFLSLVCLSHTSSVLSALMLALP